MVNGISGGAEEPEFKTGLATRATLRAIYFFQGSTFDELKPGRVIIFIIDYIQTVGYCVAGEFVATFHIFLERDDVGIAEEYSRPQSFFDHPFQDGSGAWGTAAMKQDAALLQVASVREFRLEGTSIEMSILHNCKFIDFCARLLIIRI